MKKLLIALAAVMITAASYGQGAVVFKTRIAGSVDAAVTVKDTGALAGTVPNLQAQLFIVGAGGALTALTPVTTFSTGAAGGYTKSVDVTIPGNNGTPVALRMRAWSGASYEDAAGSVGAGLYYGESSDFTVTPAVAPNPPANLVGLTAFTITTNVPEPSTIALGVLGLGALLLRRRK